MNNLNQGARQQWGAFPLDVTSPLPSQRLGSSGNRQESDYRPMDRSPQKPSTPPPASKEAEPCK